MVVAPVLAIEPTGRPEPHGPFDHVVFLSGQAVRHGGSLGFCRGADVIAIGGQTARTLADHGVRSRVPDTASSEGMIGMLANVVGSGSTVLVVAGEEGRKDLLEFLQDRGAVVTEYLCYRRVPAAPDPSLVAGVDTILVASRDGFRHVARLWFDNGGSPMVRVLAASARIAELGGELGFRNVATTGGAATGDWLTALDHDKDGNG